MYILPAYRRKRKPAVDMPDRVKTYDKSSQELIKALELLDSIRQMDVVRRLSILDKSVVDAQVSFAQHLKDTLRVAPDGLTADEIALARVNDKIAAIKSIRQRTCMGIADAKELVERWQRENNVDPCGGQH